MIYKQNPADRAKRDLLYYFITPNHFTALSALKTALSAKVAVFLPTNASSEPRLRHFIPPCSKYATNTYKIDTKLSNGTLCTQNTIKRIYNKNWGYSTIINKQK